MRCRRGGCPGCSYTQVRQARFWAIRDSEASDRARRKEVRRLITQAFLDGMHGNRALPEWGTAGRKGKAGGEELNEAMLEQTAISEAKLCTSCQAHPGEMPWVAFGVQVS